MYAVSPPPLKTTQWYLQFKIPAHTSLFRGSWFATHREHVWWRSRGWWHCMQMCTRQERQEWSSATNGNLFAAANEAKLVRECDSLVDSLTLTQTALSTSEPQDLCHGRTRLTQFKDNDTRFACIVVFSVSFNCIHCFGMSPTEQNPIIWLRQSSLYHNNTYVFQIAACKNYTRNNLKWLELLFYIWEPIKNNKSVSLKR